MRKLIACVSILFLLAALCACGGDSSTPKGVVRYGNVDCYIFKLPAGRSVEDYFQLEGMANNVHVSDPYGYMGNAQYRAESRGGYVAYTGNMVGYVPAGGDANDASSLCSRMIWDSQGYMTFDEACEYLPWLKN